ncbi:MAG: putative cytosol aminopeptidase, partial [Cyanobacteriota bacterium]
MDFRCIPDVLPAALGDFDGDCLAVGLFAADEDRPDHPQLEQLSAALGQSLTSRLEQRRFKAKPGECLSLDRLDASPQTLILVGLGAPADFNLAGLRRACAAASQ